MLRIAEMLIHLDLQAGLEDLLGEITQQASRADQIDAFRTGPGDDLLRDRLIKSTFTLLLVGSAATTTSWSVIVCPSGRTMTVQRFRPDQLHRGSDSPRLRPLTPNPLEPII